MQAVAGEDPTISVISVVDSRVSYQLRGMLNGSFEGSVRGGGGGDGSFTGRVGVDGSFAWRGWGRAFSALDCVPTLTQRHQQ